MSIRQQIFHLAGHYMIDRPGRALPASQHLERLTRSGATITQVIAQARPTPAHQAIARHIIGIERWALARLAGFGGAVVAHDEYDGYRPAAQLTLPELAGIFGDVRAEVVAMVQAIPGLETAVPQVMHNDLGPLSMGGWLRYIELHARIESKKLGK